MRLLLTFLSLSDSKLQEFKLCIVQLLDTAEKDPDDWVKVVAGLVRRWLFEPNASDFLHDKVSSTIENALKHQETESGVVSNESPYLCRQLQPKEPTQEPDFVVREEKDDEFTDKTTVKRTQAQRHSLPRPEEIGVKPHFVASRTARRSTFDPKQRTSTASQGYKRQRSKISVLEISEVQQIELEKAERKKKAAAAAALEDLAASAVIAPILTPLEPQQPPHLQHPIQFPPGFGAPPHYWTGNNNPS